MVWWDNAGNPISYNIKGEIVDTSPFNKPQSPYKYKSGQLPGMGELPVYEAPKWDEERIKSLAQRIAAPGLRNIRQQVQRASTMPSTNPNIRAMTLREALSGYGQGLESIMGGARSGAGQEYAREYGTKESEARANYEAKKQKMFAEYQAAYADYMAKEARKPIYGGVSFGGSWTTPTSRTTPTSNLVDLMGYGGSSASDFEQEDNDYWDTYQQTYSGNYFDEDDEEPVAEIPGYKETPSDYGYGDWETDYMKRYGLLPTTTS